MRDLTIGERIRTIRQARGVSVNDLAYKAGIGENGLRKIESGETKAPSLKTAVLIAEALGVPVRQIAFGDRPETTQDQQPSRIPSGPTAEAIRATAKALALLGNALRRNQLLDDAEVEQLQELALAAGGPGSSR